MTPIVDALRKASEENPEVGELARAGALIVTLMLALQDGVRAVNGEGGEHFRTRAAFALAMCGDAEAANSVGGTVRH